jgi:hypothetical protein
MASKKLDFNWSPNGFPFWEAIRQQCGATLQQAKFACALSRGMTQSGAAREAEYFHEDGDYKKAGSRTAKTQIIRKMVALANGEPMPDDEVVDADARRKIYSKYANSGDPNVAMRACELLDKWETAQRAADLNEQREGADQSFLTAVKVAPIFGCAALAEMYLERHKSLPFNSEQFRRLSPMIANLFPAQWAGWRERLKGHERTMDSLAAGELPDEFFGAEKPEEKPAETVLPDSPIEEESSDA